jgi:Tol biopolymer transport system component
MKGFLRIGALVLLTIVGLMTYARRENSGWIAFGAGAADDSAIFLMTGDGGSLRRVTREVICPRTAPRWSPDNRWITFTDQCIHTDEYLMRVSPGGGVWQSIAPATGHLWSPDGSRMWLRRGALTSFITNASGRIQRTLPRGYSLPQWSPDGEWIYAVHSLPLGRALDRINADTGVVEPLLTSTQGGSFDRGWSPDAAQLILTIPSDHGDELFTLSADGGSLQPITVDLPVSEVRRPRWSPDGAWIAFWGDGLIYRIRPDGGDLQPITNGTGTVLTFLWSPDSQWIVFDVRDGSEPEIYRIRADGSAIEALAVGGSPIFAPVVGLDWRPLWVIIVAAGVIILPLVKRFR